MERILDNIWLILSVAVVFMMMRKGGCCGGHHNHQDPGKKTGQ